MSYLSNIDLSPFSTGALVVAVHIFFPNGLNPQRTYNPITSVHVLNFLDDIWLITTAMQSQDEKLHQQHLKDVDLLQELLYLKKSESFPKETRPRQSEAEHACLCPNKHRKTITDLYYTYTITGSGHVKYQKQPLSIKITWKLSMENFLLLSLIFTTVYLNG